ncbi:hypothetical protein [Xylanimonas protaetiae]|uniref:Uncharacterized protein n=1 Tax=Xylanimonas protaetiae TaxID=2509457 RepID=A0A4P6F2S2_9MICO|nr:hypothetical protein [Xylanimonas protaetiae]QAY69475.1 hypothetical protein ET471_05005 [Xylanimonas protaetiae]
MTRARGIFWGAVVACFLIGAGIGYVSSQASQHPENHQDALYLLANHTALTWICALVAALLFCAAVAVVSLTRLVGRHGTGCLPLFGAGLLILLAAVAVVFAWFSTDRRYVVAHCGEGDTSWIAVEERPANPWTEAPRWWVLTGGPSWFTYTGDQVDGPTYGDSDLARGDYEVTCAPDGTGTLTFGDHSVPIPYPSH